MENRTPENARYHLTEQRIDEEASTAAIYFPNLEEGKSLKTDDTGDHISCLDKFLSKLQEDTHSGPEGIAPNPLGRGHSPSLLRRLRTDFRQEVNWSSPNQESSQ